MPESALFVYAYLVGSAFAALAGAAFELRAGAGRRNAPALSLDRIIFSARCCIALAAGSYLLIAELRSAREAPGRFQLPLTAAGMVIASIWALATGILLVELMAQVRSIL